MFRLENVSRQQFHTLEPNNQKWPWWIASQNIIFAIKQKRITTLLLVGVVAERLRAPNSNSGVSDHQSLGSDPQQWHFCP